MRLRYASRLQIFTSEGVVKMPSPKKILMTEDELLRFRQKFRRSRNGCWLWKAAKDTRGYPVFAFRGRQVQAHRMAYEHFIKKIEKRLLLSHSCGKRECVNPEHQVPSSMRDVLRKAGVIGKSHCKRGHPFTPENTRYDKKGSRLCQECIWDNRGVQWRDKSFCKYGHPLKPDNLYWMARYSEKQGKSVLYRRCKICMRQYQLDRYHRNKSTPTKHS
ncbi:MAG TPA: hypothetical protein VF717_12385 [Pyrinomonadaceae bacterium]|jgi:hypothetical protein